MNNQVIPSNQDQNTLINQYYHLEIINGIGIVEYQPGLKITYEDACNIVSDRLDHLGDLTYPVLVKSARVINLDKDARKYLFSEGMKNFSAMAFLESNPLEKVLSNAFIKLQPVSIPCRTFTDEVAALKWLSQFM